MKDIGNKKAYMAALLYALIAGFSFLFAKIGLNASNPIDLLAYRFSASFVVILFTIVFNLVEFTLTKEKLFKIFPLALLTPVLFLGFQAFGLQYTTSSEAGILLAVSPVFTLLLATYFLKEETTLLQKLSIVLSVVGVIYISIQKSSALEFGNLKGTVLLILSALSISGYNVMARKLTRDFSSIELSYMMNIISFVSFNVLSIGKHLVNGSLNDFFIPLKQPSFVIAILYLGICASLTTTLLTNYILSKIEASKMSVFSNLGTVISIIVGVVFLKEKIFYYHILGSMLIIGGVLGANLLDKDNLKMLSKD